MPPRRPKDKGTDAERAVVRFLQARGFPQAERRASNGNADRGDITGCPGICWEVKYRDMMPGDGRINMWLVETDRERDNAGADIGILVVRRPHAGVASWWAIARLGDLMALRDPTDAGSCGVEGRGPGWTPQNPGAAALGGGGERAPGSWRGSRPRASSGGSPPRRRAVPRLGVGLQQLHDLIGGLLRVGVQRLALAGAALSVVPGERLGSGVPADVHRLLARHPGLNERAVAVHGDARSGL